MSSAGTGQLATMIDFDSVARRVVRENGHALEVGVSGFSTRGCKVHCELLPGELISVEAVDLSLLVGEVGVTLDGRSMVTFFGSVSH